MVTPDSSALIYQWRSRSGHSAAMVWPLLPPQQQYISGDKCLVTPRPEPLTVGPPRQWAHESPGFRFTTDTSNPAFIFQRLRLYYAVIVSSNASLSQTDYWHSPEISVSSFLVVTGAWKLSDRRTQQKYLYITEGKFTFLLFVSGSTPNLVSPLVQEPTYKSWS